MRSGMITWSPKSALFQYLLLFLALIVALPSLARAETDYGKVFFGIPLQSSLDEAEKLMSARKGVKVKSIRNNDGTTSVRGNFSTGTEEVRFRDGNIILIQHKAGPYVLKTIRGVDTFFFKQLGAIAFLKVDKAEHFFSKTDFDGCLSQCNPKCGQHAPSAYHCEAGKACQAACLTQALPKDPAELQQFLFERTLQDGAQYASYWPCERRAHTTRIALEAPSGCVMRLKVSDCVGDKHGTPEKLGCMYDMLYRSK